ncbi:isoaspartyl peptidase/L-asparaginase family protein [Sphingomonas japonica]|uniref:Beta-aspartyl-peptidase (Threonine type) n=1 Tax=Sphingomonas japonica TaxID=511662 RepID=A0ABX0TWB1_9SPHN|nr:isoaspartyl peptidase/L-asparaginase [Sphingomonas japonica]NIJ22605.1 beta-aspartyl-peptidase (threonine type) [Sphingomonas japonica]
MSSPSAPRWSLAIHGGAGRFERGRLVPTWEPAARAGLAAALDAGSAILAADGSALDAVEAAVRVLEDDPAFNAGRGAVFTADGTIELDAAIMDGRDRRAGAVAAQTFARNPVTLARAVMEQSPHVLLVGDGADRFAAAHDLDPATPGWFEIPQRRAQLNASLLDDADAFDVDAKFGTVGAVACDPHGHVAAATSTGGITGKRWGRVGDSPIIGAGTYADDRACAVSATGAGEYFLRAGVAHEIAARMRLLGEDAAAAADAVIADVTALGGSGGVIVVDPTGRIAWRFSTRGMNRGFATSDGRRHVAIFGDED